MGLRPAASVDAKALNLGVAAHITEASPQGPRFDPTLSPTERSNASNAIWLCQTCAKLVDNDPTRFSTGTLQAWKRSAEETALAAVGDVAFTHNPSFDQSQICRLVNVGESRNASTPTRRIFVSPTHQTASVRSRRPLLVGQQRRVECGLCGRALLGVVFDALFGVR